ncbi:hypothetical protein AAFC00_001251 [Neodothiora populina]|uniref:L-type lectin-like domain-containing protein n=1 Tax=Neodothiora populina TaxID=2781224 RepID=A0ABR3PNE6_9PEZI
MISSTTTAAALYTLFLASAASAQYVIDSVSFGHQTPISPNGRGIPGWHLSGENHIPQLLSDRVIVTPPAPGSARGAVWADQAILHPEWSAEIDFRASGPERGSGNMNIWFVKDGRRAVGQSSIYTIGNFDGFALVIDQYGNGGGSIRGFLNDGSANFKDHHNPDSLAFAHCDYSYRNLGRPSKLRIENGHNGLRVNIDDRTCFASDNVNLPPNYFFGVTAATADNPDSFEVNKFVVSTTTSITREEPNKQPQQQQQQQQQPPHLEKLDKFPSSPEQLPDVDASAIQKQEEQFADLHNRLQGMSHQFANIFAEFGKLAANMDAQQKTLLERISSQQSQQQGGINNNNNNDALAALSRRLETIERAVQDIKRDVEGKDYRESLKNLQQAVEGVRGGVTDQLPDHITKMISTSAPRMGMFVFVVVAVQVMLIGAYVVYKKRRDNAPKKYL